MKKKMAMFGLGAVVLFATLAFGAGWRTYENSMWLGDPSVAGDRNIYFEIGSAPTNPAFRWDESEGYFTIANDGSTFLRIPQSVGSLTASEALVTNPSGVIETKSGVSSDEVGYLSGVTSDIQNQFGQTVKITGNQTVAGVKAFTSNSLIGGLTTQFGPVGSNGLTPHLTVDNGSNSQGIMISRILNGATGANLVMVKGNTGATAISDNDNIGTIRFVGHDGTDFTNDAGSIQVVATAAGANNNVPAEMLFRTNQGIAGSGTIAMLIDENQHVGIGVTDPSSDIGHNPRLHVVDTIIIGPENATSHEMAIASSGGFLMDSAGSTDPAANIFKWRTAPIGVNSHIMVEKMRLNSDGDLGIGTTDPLSRLDVRFSVNSTAITVADAGVYLHGNDNGHGLAMGIKDSRFWMATAVNDNTASSLSILLNPLGGAVAIGTELPAATFHVNGNAYISTSLSLGDVFTASSGADNYLRIHRASSNFNVIHITNAATGSGGADGTKIGLDNSGAFVIRNQEGAAVVGDILFQVQSATQARLTHDGFFGIGLDPANKLHVGAAITNSYVAFIDNTGSAVDGGTLRIGSSHSGLGREALRIDNSGTNAIFTVMPAGRMNVGGTDNYGAGQLNVYSTGDALRFKIENNGEPFIWAVTNGYATSVCMSGGFGSLRAVGECTSSIRFKEAVEDISDEDADKVYTVMPRKFRWKESNEGMQQAGQWDYGFIAEEMLDTFPEIVSIGKLEDGTPAPGGLSYSHFTAILTKTVQNQKKEIDFMKAWICDQDNAPEALCVGE